MPQSSPDFLCSDPLRRETLHTLFPRLAPFLLVLGGSRPLVGVDSDSSEVVQQTPRPLFSLPPTQPAPPTSSPNITHFRNPVSSMPHKSRKQDPRPAYSRLDALTSRLDKRGQIRNRMVGAIALSPTDAATGSYDGLGAACRSGTRASSTWRSRTALSGVPQLLASGSCV